MATLPRIAVVGLGGRFPGAETVAQFWENVLGGIDSAGEPAPGRWILNPDRIHQPGEPHEDRVLSKRACFLSPFSVDLTGLDIDPDLVEQLDLLFQLTLTTGGEAWRSARMDRVDRSRVGVILGAIALPTETTAELTWKILGRAFFEKQRSLPPDCAGSLPHPLNRHVTGLPAGILAHALRLGGIAYTLDAACASSLYAIKLAVDELQAGRADAMLAGGVSRPDSLYTQMGFSQLRALSPSGRCSPFDQNGDGLVVGEGAGIFVLKREEDAIAHGDRIWGVIVGAGISNDIGGGLLAPVSEGQLRAMRQAYTQAGWNPDEVDLIECHATGTPVGDAVEFQSLKTLWEGHRTRSHKCVIGSVKSSVGHLLTGAGAAALTKTLFALTEGILPPTANFRQAAPTLDMESSPFEVLKTPRPWTRSSTPRRAAVSAFGFGGINAHLLIEEAGRTPAAPVLTAASSPPDEIAIVALSTLTPPRRTIRDFVDALHGADLPSPQSAVDSWGLSTPAGYYFDAVEVPSGAFRIPPREIEEMLPQQALALLVCREVLAQTELGGKSHPDVGVYLGVALDLATTNFHLRWGVLRDTPDRADAAHPPLTANRTMGALASIAASRIAREYRLGGPSFTLSAGPASGLCALEAASRALQRKDINAAVVCAVDLADVREVNLLSVEKPTSGAVAMVVKRLEDARHDGDTIYATLSDFATTPPTGHLTVAPGAERGLMQLAEACLRLHHRLLPSSTRTPIPWLRNRVEGPRLLTVAEQFAGDHLLKVTLKEGTPARESGMQPREGLFLIEGETLAELQEGIKQHLLLSQEKSAGIVDLARRIWKSSERTISGSTGRAIVLLARDTAELRDLLLRMEQHLRQSPQKPLTLPSARDRIFYSADPLGGPGQLAFVYPGSGNDFIGMGRDIALRRPTLLERQDRENDWLARQYLPECFWFESPRHATVQDRIFAQVALGSLVTDALVGLGVQPDGVIGYSLGESSALFSLRAWPARDVMLTRMDASTLFTSDLTGVCNAARAAWGLSPTDVVDWQTGIVEKTPDEVQRALSGLSRAYLQIINTPRECVIGGQRDQIQELARRLNCTIIPVPETTTMHCSVVRPVAESYRELHVLPTVALEGVRFYSGGLGRAYDIDTDSAADAILAQALDTVDFPAVVESAYRDGIRVFIEVGPGASCSRMISSILGNRPHLARSACVPGPDGLAALTRVVAALIAERVPIDLEQWFGSDVRPSLELPPGKSTTVPVGGKPFADESPRIHPSTEPKEESKKPISVPQSLPPETTPMLSESTEIAYQVESPALAGWTPTAQHQWLSAVGEQISHSVDVGQARSEAHAAYLQLSDSYRHTLEQNLLLQGRLHDAILAGHSFEGYSWESAEVESPAVEPPVALNRRQCMEFAVGSIGNVLGEAFAGIDAFPTRVRLPDEPLMLVDRILTIEGEPLSMSSGRVVTEHDIHPGAWYLDGGRIPTCIAVEAGQADLFLSGYLGIDYETRGLAVYRLLDAAVTFHRRLPGPGEVIHYDIHIDHFFRQGDTYLFRFRFVGTVNGEILLTMTDGCAGFFTEEALSAGKGVVHTALQKQSRPGVVPADGDMLPPMKRETYSEAQVDHLREGNLAGCFGPLFAGLPVRQPQRLPGGRMRLVHRVVELDPVGGRFGIGRIRAEADIHPDDWFITCHFIDDQVMPGTLMYECCLHTFRIFLMRLGWIGEHDQVACEPVTGVTSRLKCRGQVLATTRVVTYEVVLKERGYRPEPYAVADAHMYADGKLIVDIENMSVRFSGLTREQIAATWTDRAVHSEEKPLYTREQILAFAIGKPSEAFGERYLPFDRERFIARLPAPPYSFLDRILAVQGEPWKMVAGDIVEADYDVPAEEWYFQENRSAIMPFCVLAEIPLQVCGWLAAYMGSALTSEIPLHFRNLSAKATLHRVVTPATGTLRTRIKCTRVAASGGMIIQDYALQTSDSQGVVYEGSTTFGFFSKEALSQQIGIRDAKPYVPTEEEKQSSEAFAYPTEPPFVDRMLRMVDRITCYLPRGGAKGLGFLEGTKEVRPEEWFFAAHFYQDPVMPGSLGLEAFLQLLQLAAARRWNASATARFEANRGNHHWIYRGQVIPTNKRVTVQATILSWDEEHRQVTGEGYLSVDGLVIYQMNDFTVRVIED